MKLFKDFLYAITSPEKYRDFMNYRRKRLVLYVFVLVVLTQVILMGPMAVKFMASGGFEALLTEVIPEFSASSEEGFWIEEPIDIDEYNVLIKASSDEVKEDITDIDGEYGSYDYVIMVDREQIYVKSPGMQEITARFNEMPGFNVTKQDIIDYTSLLYAAAVWVFLLSIIMNVLAYFLVAIVVSLFAGILASFMRVRLGSQRLFKMSVYAGTASFLVEFAQTMFGFTIPNYTIFSYIITLGYLYFAIKDYKDSGIEELPPEQFGGREER